MKKKWKLYNPKKYKKTKVTVRDKEIRCKKDCAFFSGEGCMLLSSGDFRLFPACYNNGTQFVFRRIDGRY